MVTRPPGWPALSVTISLVVLIGSMVTAASSTRIPGVTITAEDDMARVTEWIQREWLYPNTIVYGGKGDFYDADSLLPAEDGRLKRAEQWNAHIDLPSGIQNLEAGFWDHDNNRYVFLGEDDGETPSDVCSLYFNSAWGDGTVVTLSEACAGLGGIHSQNFSYWDGDLYFIGSDAKVYRNTGYTSGTATAIDTDGDASLLFPVGDRMYMITTSGEVMRLNDADDGFETHYAPVGTMDVRFATAYRGYILLFIRDATGTMHICRLPDRGTETPVTLHELARINGTGDIPDQGCLFAVHDDKVYFSPGRILTQAGTNGVLTRYWIDIYVFTGSHIEHVARHLHIPNSPETVGLLPWRQYLLYYALDDGSSTRDFKVLWGDQFTDLDNPSFYMETGHESWIGEMNSLVVLTCYDETNGEGIMYLGDGDRADGEVVTSWLDFDAPSRQKRLEALAVTLDSHASNFKALIYYRTDDNTSWTTAGYTFNTDLVMVTGMDVDFYKLQIKVKLWDESAYNHDIRIASIGATVTEPS